MERMVPSERAVPTRFSRRPKAQGPRRRTHNGDAQRGGCPKYLRPCFPCHNIYITPPEHYTASYFDVRLRRRARCVWYNFSQEKVVPHIDVK